MDNNHGDHKSPRPGVVGPLPFMAYQLLVLTNWDDPPSGCLGYIRDEILPIFVGIIITNHEIRIPPLNNQDSMGSKAVFFSHMICDFMIQGFQMTEDP